MFVSAITVTGSALAYVGIRTYQRRNLADRPEVPGLEQVVTTLYTQTQGRLTAATTKLLALTEAAVALPATYRRPVLLVDQLSSPWEDLPAVLPQQAAQAMAQQPQAVGKGQWQLYRQYLYYYWRPYWKWGVAAFLLSGTFGLYLVIYATKLKLLIDAIAVTTLGGVLGTLLKLLAVLPVAFLASLLGERLIAQLSSRIAIGLLQTGQTRRSPLALLVRHDEYGKRAGNTLAQIDLEWLFDPGLPLGNVLVGMAFGALCLNCFTAYALCNALLCAGHNHGQPTFAPTRSAGPQCGARRVTRPADYQELWAASVYPECL